MAVSMSPTPTTQDDLDLPEHDSGLAPTESSLEEQVAEIERVMEQIGTGYLADLRKLSQAFSRFYEAQLDAKEKQLAAMIRRAETAEHTCATLEEQLKEVQQARSRQAAELRVLGEQLIQRIADT